MNARPTRHPPVTPSREPNSDYFEKLLSILRHPETGAMLRMIAPPQGLPELPAAVTALLVADGDATAFPVFGLICSFLPEHRVKLEGATSLAPTSLDSIKAQVRKHYDQYGWKPDSTGQYNDTAAFGALDPGVYRLYELESHMALMENLPGGEFMLDAASGAIALPDYLAFSWFYRYRVCVDLSLTALQQAEMKLGTAAFYVLSDICHLPFADEVFEGLVSGYTVQHVPEQDQELAVGELYRVLKSGSTATFMAGRPTGAARRLATAAWQRLKGRTAGSDTTLYYHPREATWWKAQGRRLGGEVTVKSLRLLAKHEFELMFKRSLAAMRLFRAADTLAPRLLAHVSAILRVDIKKRART